MTGLVNAVKEAVGLGQTVSADTVIKTSTAQLPQTGEKDSHLAGLGILSLLAAVGAFASKCFKKKEL
ncbi:LPXTG cell wall anchor domain-containing protein [Streptococcus sp. TATVAM-FAB21]|uniref:LPXTG cell wall anchor domain-containing protein n=1 Tax=Streptococcus sp. TATVAM-FAB21 TaxID=3093698 RepID=UPI0039811BF5